MSDIEQTTIKLTRGVPATEAFPIEEIIACSATVLRDHGKTLLQYQPAIGFLPLREIIASQAGVTPEQVVLSNGSIQLAAFLAEVLLPPGEAAFVEEPSYDRTITTLRRAGVKVVGIPLEDDGIDITFLEEAVKEHHPRLLYLIPDFQNPTGVTTSLAKREAIVSLVKEHDFMVVEDLPYRRLRYQGSDLPTLRELDAKRVIQLSSFSKLLSPGIRVGWMVAPVSIAKQVMQIATDTYITPNMLGQGLAYEFIHEGRLEANIEQLHALYAPRLAAMLNALSQCLPQASWTKPEGGFFVGLTLPAGVNSARVAEKAKEEKLALSNSAGFFANGDGSRFIRLPFCALREEEIEEAIKRLARVVQAINQQ
ncbi:TPA: PLP-dependent aminotransferase family protein [Candidatus Acetothermia bacterium]|nr:PLP-dependent aminotransferase family protein [Candidatus Acetothermia bacterium]